MIKNILLFVFYICVSQQTVGQQKNWVEDIEIECKNILFITSDTSYECSLFIKPNGVYFFHDSFVDTCKLDDRYERIWYNNAEEPKEIKTSYHFLGNTDTIISIFPNDRVCNKESSFSQIYDNLNASYILHQLGEFNMDEIQKNELRLFYPCEAMNYPHKYQVLSFFFSEDSVKMEGIIANSIDYRGIQPGQHKSVFLNKGDIKRLKKEMKRSITDMSIDCRDPGNPWIIEFYRDNLYYKYTMSYYCLRDNGELSKHMRFSFMLLRLSRKYLEFSCK